MQLAYASERARQWLVALLVALASPLVVSARATQLNLPLLTESSLLPLKAMMRMTG